MPLWTEVLEPSELTGFARAALQAAEDRNGSLERWLPNTHVDNTHVSFTIGENGLQEAAEFRAFDTEPSIARQSQGKGVMLEMPALGQKMPVSEYRALRLRNASDDAYRSHILKTTNQIVRAIADRIEVLRGVVLDTGKATVNQRNFKMDDDFGRPAGHNVVAGALWNTSSVDRLTDLLAWQDLYATTNNGTLPGALLMSTRSFGSLKAGDQFINVNTGRPMSREQISSVLVDEGLPPIYIYDRKIKSYEGVTSRVTSDDSILFLPTPGAEGESELGATYWGTTLTATELGWGIEDDERAGIVAGVVKSDNVPVIAEVVADAIGMPVLGNAALSLRARVL
jgi:Phage major capsid protein E